MAEPFFTLVIPNHKPDRDLGGNSRVSHWVVRRRQKKEHELVASLFKSELNRMGLDGNQFITNLGEHSIEECLPVSVTFRRFYSGTSNKWDEDNLYGAYKPAQDAIKQIIGIDDKHFKTSVEQIRDDFTELEICICPAWALMEGEASNGPTKKLD